MYATLGVFQSCYIIVHMSINITECNLLSSFRGGWGEKGCTDRERDRQTDTNERMNK